MATISGLSATQNSAVYDLVQQYMFLERQPLARLENSRAEIRAQSGAYTDLATKLRALRTAADGFQWFGSLTPLNTFSASSSNSDVLGATAGGGAAVASHTVHVASLARAHSLVSDAFAGEEDAALAGTHTLEIVQGDEAYQITVTVAEGDTFGDVLRSLATAVNDSGADLTATVATTDARSGTKRLLVTSQLTGTGAMIQSVADADGKLATALGLTGSSGGSAYSANTVQAAADAVFTVNGLDFISSTNRISGALAGVTLNLLAPTTGDVTVTVARDVEAVTQRVEGLLTAYNELVGYVREKTSGADETGAGRGMFTGNTLFMSLRTRLRQTATANVPDPLDTSTLKRLAQIGITAERDGKLTISNRSDFEEALETRAGEVERLFNDEEEGVAVRMVTLVDTYVKAGGLISQQRKLIQGRERIYDRRIAQMEVTLARREEQLTEELGSLQNILYQLTSQQSYLNSLMSQALSGSY